MPRVRIKIEGLTDAATAATVAAMGADAVGLVLAPSPRQVSVEQARAVAAALPPWVSTVGVFVNSPAEEINRAIEQAHLQYVQLHGDEGPAGVGFIQGARVLKAFRVRDDKWLTEVTKWLDGLSPASREKLCGIVLDAYDPSARGGTGKQFNWQWVAQARLAGQLAHMPPIILAGGLNPANVADAIAAVQPYGVDVASGVESSPAVKDLDKVRAFIAEVARAASQ